MPDRPPSFSAKSVVSMGVVLLHSLVELVNTIVYGRSVIVTVSCVDSKKGVRCVDGSLDGTCVKPKEGLLPFDNQYL